MRFNTVDEENVIWKEFGLPIEKEGVVFEVSNEIRTEWGLSFRKGKILPRKIRRRVRPLRSHVEAFAELSDELKGAVKSCQYSECRAASNVAALERRNEMRLL